MHRKEMLGAGVKGEVEQKGMMQDMEHE